MENIEIESIGKLSPHPDVPDEWLISESIAVPLFDGEKLQFTLNGDLETDKMFLFEADEAIKNFLKINEDVKLIYSGYIYQNYKEVQDYYASEPYVVAPLKLNNEKEIWKYVYPSEIYVSRRNRRDKDVYLQIHCECEWEEEHGLQLVFRRGLKLTRVSYIDGHLTEADANDKPDSEDELLSKF